MTAPTSLLAPIYTYLLGNNCRITATNDYVGHYLTLLANFRTPWTTAEARLLCNEYSLLFHHELSASARIATPPANFRTSEQLAACTMHCRSQAPALVSRLEELQAYGETLDCFEDQMTPVERRVWFKARAVAALPWSEVWSVGAGGERFLPARLVELHHDVWLHASFEEESGSEGEGDDEDDRAWVAGVWQRLREVREFVEGGMEVVP
ncbi:uncharacterized protein H6S33_001858 [Morchella sextelata]|uniref:uncharacterized protein n=1 Tax=Morchella sextelata TaxID=1174677 RepID=UPI001D0551C0|nr:uncharacterized protein H6S33_001858 [Morchella sextelata]KAH0608724.1 hypothetical protein H6S33_001858 [Morchella sextelata]